MKTIRELWHETPPGERITDAGYLKVCDLLETGLKMSIQEFASALCRQVFDLTPEQAIAFIDQCIKEKASRDAVAIADEARALNRPLTAPERERVIWRDYYARLDAYMGIDSRKRPKL